MKDKVKRTERGWPGHFICADACKFRRNTLLEYGDKKWVVSTVGCMVTQDKVREIGLHRHYETMAFEAIYEEPYWEADVSKPIHFESEWAFQGYLDGADLKANDMHEKVVSELMEKIKL